MSGKNFPAGVALGIGGSGGTGSAICRELARAGSDVVLTYHQNQKRANEVKASVEALNRQGWVQPVSATISFSLSAGVKYCNVFLGR